MPWYAADILKLLCVVWLSASISVVIFWRKGRLAGIWQTALAAGLILRVCAIDFDPFLHNWDERFHALVARNMVNFPFKPMLRVDPVLPYVIKDWCCNHVWVHKQPLFMWQMALSMKILGVSVWAMRLPSAIMGAVALFFVRDIARFWANDERVGGAAAFLMAFSYFNIELATGRLALDHNDLAFTFYVTASIWAFVKYQQGFAFKWAIWTGILVGCAVLNKWLPGFLVYTGWGVALLMDKERRQSRLAWGHLAGSVAAAFAVFLPWQWYIRAFFPEESQASYAFNWRHVFEALDGHGGSSFYHIAHLPELYNSVLLGFAAVGLIIVLLNKDIKISRSLIFLVPVLVLFLFFSVLVQTKMPAFTYPVSAIFFALMGIGLVKISDYLSGLDAWWQQWSYPLVLSVAALMGLRGSDLMAYRQADNPERNAQFERAEQYRSVPDDITNNHLIFNCTLHGDVEMMFYKKCNAYHAYPDSAAVQDLQKKGYKLAFFIQREGQIVPTYIKPPMDTNFLIIDKKLQ